ncbi:MAG: peptidoglycan DD-metalloendopeptidase family protein [Gammaproteobacteria bacterium]
MSEQPREPGACGKRSASPGWQERAARARDVPPALLALMLLAALLAGCQSPPRAPVEQKTPPRGDAPAVTRDGTSPPAQRPAVTRPTTHVVVRGDTLHGIAFRHGLDYRDLVRWNAIRNPDLIFVGQRLRLTAPSRAAVAPRAAPPPAAAPRTAARPPAASAPAAPAAAAAAPAAPARPAPAAGGSGGRLAWTWPSSGKASRATSVTGNRGLEIRGTRGEAVKAAAEGAVVYSGSGLRGYGELIIIKHNDTFLSAYAHNESRLVQEGQRVKGGQLIARMGDTEAREVMLHFEIRRNGKSVDPLQYLPQR